MRSSIVFCSTCNASRRVILSSRDVRRASGELASDGAAGGARAPPEAGGTRGLEPDFAKAEGGPTAGRFGSTAAGAGEG
jgi:hypothetical protein